MQVDKEPNTETKGDSESSDFEDCGIIGETDLSLMKKTFPPSSTSGSDGERTEVEDSDNDSGFVGNSQGSLDRLDTVTPDLKNETEDCQASEPMEINGVYNRNAILRNLVNFKNEGEAQAIHLDALALARQANSTSEEPSKIEALTDEELLEKLKCPELQESVLESTQEYLKAIPDSILHLLTGRHLSGDCGRPSDQKPEWLDMEKLKRGQKFAQDYMFPVYFAELISLMALFSFDDGLKPLILSGKSSTPFTAFKRYLSTGLRIRNWYTQDIWAKDSDARKDILTVRVKHAAIKRKIDTMTNEEIDVASKIPNPFCPLREVLLKDFLETCEAPVVGQCPFVEMKNTSFRHKGMNQADMAITQWGFIGLITSYPKRFGVHYATDEDLEDFLHLWRVIGYALGLEDEYNFCRGTLQDVRQRSADFLETWVKPNLRIITPEWEHMMRSVVTGLNVYFPGCSYECALLYLTEVLDIRMPRLNAALSYRDWFAHNLTKSLFNYTIKLPGILSSMNSVLNRSLDRAAKYTPEEFEKIRIKLAGCPASDILGTKKNNVNVVVN